METLLEYSEKRASGVGAYALERSNSQSGSRPSRMPA